MNLDQVVFDLKKERDRLTRAIEALIDSYSPWSTNTKAAGNGRRGPRRKKRGGLTPAGRRKLSLAMKKRWAARKKVGKKALAG